MSGLGLTGIESYQYFVRDLERSRDFYCNKLDFAEVGESSQQAHETLGEKSLVFNAGNITVQCSVAVSDHSDAKRFLDRHPAGVGRVSFQVRDADAAFSFLQARGATPRTSVQRTEGEGGSIAYFDITTPFGDTFFRFVERKGYRPLFPGIETLSEPRGGKNRFKFQHVDHITSNFLTMSPALLWMEHVMGLRRFWDVEFHTTDVSETQDRGSGLRSVVMYDDDSGVKFANNEPWRPFFEQSQIFVFNRDHGGDGIQHLALTVEDIIPTVRELRSRGVQFMPTPGTYYDALPERIEQMGIKRIDEDVDVLRELEILVDGAEENSYLLQIFLKEAAGLYREPQAGPFFYEVIQRKGDQGFGAGNFRALFESIERAQQSEGRV